ncbi:MAG: transcription antitermination factor NusB [Gammaproteobacteria bacterium]|nr:transcription antitermination factor NusB [Gammaproteobacteria bacterium]
MIDRQKVNSTQRHRARSFAMQAIYQWELSGEEVNVVVMQFLTQMNPKKTDVDYFRELVYGVILNSNTLDAIFVSDLDRELDTLGPIELAILRLAIFELQDKLDVPYKVVINEAIELAKTFAAVDSHKYINGVLDRIVPTLRAAECGSKTARPAVTAKKATPNKIAEKPITVIPAKEPPPMREERYSRRDSRKPRTSHERN